MVAFKNLSFMVFHFLAAAHYIFAFYYDWVYVLPEEIKLRDYSFGGKLVYMTVWNCLLQATYFSVAFVNDLFGSNEAGIKDRPLARRIKDHLFATLAFPLAFNVAILFWTLYFKDRSSVFPEEVDAYFPSWLNQILHTNVAVLMVIELLVLHREYPTRKQGILTFMAFMFSYFIWMCVTRYFAGRWAYPIIDGLNLPLMCAFFAFTIVIHPLLMYFLGEFLNARIWSVRGEKPSGIV